MSILSVDNISPIGSGTSVTVNNAATLVVNNVNVSGVSTFSDIVDVAGSNSTIRLGNGANRRLMYRSGDNDVILEGANNFFYRQMISDTSHRWYTNGADEKLMITGAGSVIVKSGNLELGSTSGTDSIIHTTNAAGILYRADENGHRFQTYVGGWQDRLSIKDDGKIGINKNSPTYSLDIVGDQINLQSNAAASNAVVRLRGQNTSTGGAIVAMNSAGNSGPLEFWNGGAKSFSIGSDNTPAFFSPDVAWHEGPAVLEASNGYAEIFFRSTGSEHGTSISGTWGIGKLASTNGFGLLKHGMTGGGAVRVDAVFSADNSGYMTFGKTTRSPKQIRFLVRAGRGGDGYTNNPYQFHTVIQNETSGFSGGWDTVGKTKFTAPVTGFYYFSTHAAYGQSGVSFGTRILRYNSSNALQDTYELYRFIQGSANSHYGGAGSITLPLDAGDYVVLQPQYTPYHLNNNLNFFCGFLVG